MDRERTRMNEPEEMSSGDARRQLRRELERSAVSGASDKTLLSNIMLVGLVTLAAAVSFFGIKLSWGSIGQVSIMTVFLYAITSLVYRNRYGRGKMRGCNDAEYRAALEEYRARRRGMEEDGVIGQVPAFCREYKKRELEEYRADLLLNVDMTYKEYRDKYMGLPDKHIMETRLPAETKKVLIKCNRAKPLRLTPGMILNENGEADRHKLLGKSGAERERSDKSKQMVKSAAWILFGSVVAFDVLADPSMANLLRWAIRMAPVASAIIFGDDDGFCSMTVTETGFKRGQAAVIHLFREWLSQRGAETPAATPVAAETEAEEPKPEV